MARPVDVQRVVVSGSLVGGEAFAWGYWLDSAAGSQTTCQAEADAIRTLLTDFDLTWLKPMISSDCSYDKVTVYSYETTDPAATYVAESTFASGVGTGAAGSLPLQLAVCASLRTDRPGRRYRGRLFLPINNATLTDHQLSDTQTDNIATSIAAHFTRVNANTTIVGAVSVVSVVGGFATPVASVIVDSRLDVQRRRAASEASLFEHLIAV